MNLTIDTHSMDSYRSFLAVKSLPKYRFAGRTAVFPDEYSATLGLTIPLPRAGEYSPAAYLFDYQRDIAAVAIQKQKYAVFADCGLGKTAIILEFVRHVREVLPPGRCVLIVSPLNVIRQTLAECGRFYGDSLSVERLPAKMLQSWLLSGESQIGITNYEALRDGLAPGRLGGLVLDESSMLKSHYGKHGVTCLSLGKGLGWKLACSGTPAPNDRVEYANHAVFLDAVPSVNSFLAKYFVNRGQTSERWEMKPHAVRAFHRDMSHWSIFLTNPSMYGWSDGVRELPPINVHVHEVPLTPEQEKLSFHDQGLLFPDEAGGITSRSKAGQIAKGSYKGQKIPTLKPAYIRDLVASWSGDESTIIWCRYNAEQDALAEIIPGAVSVCGKTSEFSRDVFIRGFQEGKYKVLISKPKILGFGLNLQVATRMVFSSLHDSYEEYYQAVKRANRHGSVRPLNVHIPLTEIERPMAENVLQKARRAALDAAEQEAIFLEESNWKIQTT